MISIDPDLVDQAVAELRQAAVATDDLVCDLNRAAHLSAVWPATRMLFFEIAEELDLLASVLNSRANLARGFVFGLSGLGNDFAASSSLENLLGSLTNQTGYSPGVTGDLAIAHLAEHFDRFDLDRHRSISKAELTALLATHPPGHFSEADRSAIEAIVSLPSLADHFSLDQLNALLEHNDALRLLAPMIADLAAQGQLALPAAELRSRLIELNPQLRTEIDNIFSNRHLFASIVNGAIDIDLDALLVRGINSGAFLHSGNLAANFLRSLPQASTRSTGIDIRLTDTAALRQLHQVAIGSASSMRDAALLTPFLPETVDAYRCRAITWTYAFLALDLEAVVNPDNAGQLTAPGHSGNVWLTYGATASHSVTRAITGDEEFLTFNIRHDMRQAFADGNQIIAASAIPAFVSLLKIDSKPDRRDDQISAYLGTFVDGEAELRQAMARQLEAIASADPVVRQQLQFESNALLGVHEQTILDDKLNFRLMPLVQQVGAKAASMLDSCATSVSIGSIAGSISNKPGCSIEPRSGGGILTDNGSIAVIKPDGPPDEIPLDVLATNGDKTNNQIANLRLDDLNLELSLPGQADLETAGDAFDVDSNPDDWVDTNGNYRPAGDWSNLDERMPSILQLFQDTHADQSFFDAAQIHANTTP